MKTHELANALTALARILKEGPNVDLRELQVRENGRPGQQRSPDIALNISTLSALSEIGKGQWEAFIHDNKLPIEITLRDSSRNIIGKLLSFLNRNPKERERIVRQAAAKHAKASPELTKALSWLLKDSNS